MICRSDWMNCSARPSLAEVIDWQKLACALATRGAFSIITGGPGTGKTTTVVRLLALLQAPAVEAACHCAFVWRHRLARPLRG